MTTRRRLLAWSAPFVALALVVSLKLLATAWFAAGGMDDYRSGSYRSAQEQFAHTGVGNVYERWLTSFNRGDAFYGQKQYRTAEKQFDRALTLAPTAQKCRVRGNLALAGEQVGAVAVKAKNRQAAITAFTRALHNATDGNCRSLAPRRAELRQLLELLRKKQTVAPPPPGKSGGKSSTPPSSQDKLDQRNQRAARTQGDTDNANPTSTPSPNPNGKPW